MFNDIYGLREDEVIRRVEPPFVEERMDYYRRERPSQAEKIPRVPDAMMLMWHDGKLKNSGVFFGRQPDGGRGYQLHNLIQYLLKIFPQDLEGNAQLAEMTIPGDFVARADADSEQYRAARAENHFRSGGWGGDAEVCRSRTASGCFQGNVAGEESGARAERSAAAEN